MFSCFRFLKKSEKKDEGSELLRMMGKGESEKEPGKVAEESAEGQWQSGDVAEEEAESQTKSEALGGIWKKSVGGGWEPCGDYKESEETTGHHMVSEELIGSSMKFEEIGNSQEAEKPIVRELATKDGMTSLQACLAARRRFVRPDSATSSQVSEFEEEEESGSKDDEMVKEVKKVDEGPGSSGTKKGIVVAWKFGRKEFKDSKN